MTLYLEFNGKRLKGTECFNYQEARYVLIKILDQCMDTYKKNYNERVSATEQLQIQYKILSSLKMVQVQRTATSHSVY